MLTGYFNGFNGLRLVLRAAGWPFTIILIGIFRVYQLVISPLFGPSCKFYPSCSNYVLAAVRVHGPVKGLILGASRISRCHPWQLGGINPIPLRGRWRSELDLDGNSKPRS